MYLPAPIPTGTHKLAADRLLRLTAQEGTVEALAFYDRLDPGARRIVFALVARIASGHIAPVDGLTEVWTDEELRRCHNLFVQGVRTPWVNHGHRVYKRNAARRSRAAERGGPPANVFWTAAEDAAVLDPGRPPDIVLESRLGRTVGAIRSRRKVLRRRDSSLVAV